MLMSLFILGILDMRMKDTPTLSVYVPIGFILSAFCSYIFPKKSTIVLEKISIKPGKTGLIKEYIRDSGSMFLYIAIGYFGLLLWLYSSTVPFDIGWWSGLFFIFLYLQGLVTPFLKPKNEYV